MGGGQSPDWLVGKRQDFSLHSRWAPRVPHLYQGRQLQGGWFHYFHLKALQGIKLLDDRVGGRGWSELPSLKG